MHEGHGVGTDPIEGSTSGSERVQETAHQVADRAQEAARQATGKAGGVLRQQVDQRSAQAGGRISDTAGDLRAVGDTLRDQGQDRPARLADQVAERAERLGSYLRESDAERILHDVEDLGRRQPWVVVTAGLAAGLLAARFLRASSTARYQARSRPGADRPVSAGTTEAGYAGAPEASGEVLPSGAGGGR